MRRKTLAALVAALCSLALLAACGGDDERRASSTAQRSTTAHAFPSRRPADRHRRRGRTRSSADTDKDLTLVFFGYTNCPDICGAVMSSLAAAMTRLDESDRDRVDVVFVTTDPARDDEATLRRYLEHFDPSVVGLTGDLDTISAVALPLGVGVEKGKKLPTGGYEVDPRHDHHGHRRRRRRPRSTGPSRRRRRSSPPTSTRCWPGDRLTP